MDNKDFKEWSEQHQRDLAKVRSEADEDTKNLVHALGELAEEAFVEIEPFGRITIDGTFDAKTLRAGLLAWASTQK